MARYEIVALYKNEQIEVSVHAEKLSSLYGLDIRYEKLPDMEASVAVLLSEKTVVCMLNRKTMRFRKLLRYIYQITKPILIIENEYSLESYNNLKIPVGYLIENKEKVVWANFFQRNNEQSQVELLIPMEKDPDIAGLVANNVSFIEDIFDNSDALYTKSFFKGSFEKILKDTLIREREGLVFVMLPFRVFPFYIPLNLRIVKRYMHTPVLIIPRDDKLYIPCH